MRMNNTRKNKRGRFYGFMRLIARVMTHSVLPIKIINAEFLTVLPPPYIIISNHKSALDPVVLACAVKKHEVRFLAKKELMSGKLTKWLLGTLLHVIPVDRHSSDIKALRTSIQKLKEGCVIGIFPEGTRHKNGLMTEIEGGVAIIALRSAAPIIPAFITPKLRFFHKTHVIFGTPIDISDLVGMEISNNICDLVLARIREKYAEIDHEAKLLR